VKFKNILQPYYSSVIQFAKKTVPSIHTKLTYYQNPAAVYEESCGAVCKTIARAAKDTYPDEMGIYGQKPAFQSGLLYPPEMRFLQKTD